MSYNACLSGGPRDGDIVRLASLAPLVVSERPTPPMLTHECDPAPGGVALRRGTYRYDLISRPPFTYYYRFNWLGWNA